MAMIAVVLPLSGMVISFSSDDNDISEMEGVAAAVVVVEAAGSAALALGPHAASHSSWFAPSQTANPRSGPAAYLHSASTFKVGVM